jgi:hypothetical protein
MGPRLMRIACALLASCAQVLRFGASALRRLREASMLSRTLIRHTRVLTRLFRTYQVGMRLPFRCLRSGVAYEVQACRNWLLAYGLLACEEP